MGTTYYISPELMFKSLMGYHREGRVYNGEEEYKSRRVSIKLFGEYRFDFMQGDYMLTAGVGGEKETLDSWLEVPYEGKKEMSTLYLQEWKEKRRQWIRGWKFLMKGKKGMLTLYLQVWKAATILFLIRCLFKWMTFRVISTGKFSHGGRHFLSHSENQTS